MKRKITGICLAFLLAISLTGCYGYDQNGNYVGGSNTTAIAGPTGLQGIQGLTGANGTQGIQGLTGANGTQGIQGLTGANGTNGTNGTNGLNGTSLTTIYYPVVGNATRQFTNNYQNTGNTSLFVAINVGSNGVASTTSQVDCYTAPNTTAFYTYDVARLIVVCPVGVNVGSSLFFVVLPQQYYTVRLNSGNMTIGQWTEWK